jgi:alpha-1,3/alpha-1,6-mannosyltransferase
MSIPLLRMKRCPILFYCHYPDKLLCVNRKNCFKRLYRWFIDKIEEWTMSFAHRIVVNSKFTQNTFLNAFPSINKGKCCIRKHIPEVLYPTIDLAQFDKTTLTSVNQVKGLENLKGKYLLSLNRYEAKKHIELAIDAFELVLKEAKDGLSLVIAGGYDDRVNENAQVYNQLKKIVEDKKVADKVIFLKNISNEERNTLMKNAFSLLYTPQNEHFGIVPLEGMYNGALVLACNSGGPLESIENNVTGYTLPPDPAIWANKLVEALNNPEVGKMREAAKARVLSIFTNESFSSQLHKIIIGMCPQKKKIE